MNETMPEPSPKKSGRNVPVIIMTVALVVAVVVIVVLVSKSADKGMVKVPALVGKDSAAACQLADKSGVAVMQQARVNSDSAPVGVAVMQQPKPGTKVKKGDTVFVTVSKGRLANVPRLTGFRKDDAPVELGKAGLSLGRVTTASSDSVPAGRIVTTAPPPDSEVELGRPVDLVVSTGPRYRPPPPVPASFERPQMQFQSLDVVGPTRRGFNMGVNLNAQNPNSVPGKIKAFYYKLEVDTFYLGSGTYYCNTLLPPGGNADSRVDVNISYDRLGPAAAALVQRGEVPYRVRGYYVLEAEGGRSIEPVLTTGRFNVSEALRPWMGMFR